MHWCRYDDEPIQSDTNLIAWVQDHFANCLSVHEGPMPRSQIPQQKPSVNLVNFAVPTTRPATSNVNINFITSPKHSRKSCRLNRFFGFVNASQCQGHDCKSAGGKFLEGVRLVTCT